MKRKVVLLAQVYLVFYNIMLYLGEQVRHSGESAHIPPLWPGFNSSPVPCVGFSLGTPVFLPPQKPTSPNSYSTRIEDPPENQPRLMWLPL